MCFVSYDVIEKCRAIWFADGKDHYCDVAPGALPHKCKCSCGQVRRKNEGPRTPANPFAKYKKAPLKLARWKRGKKVVMS